jgi:hypothetical protein
MGGERGREAEPRRGWVKLGVSSTKSGGKRIGGFARQEVLVIIVGGWRTVKKYIDRGRA